MNVFQPVHHDDKFTSKEVDILMKNKAFYARDIRYVNIMLEIINGESNISIRVLEWFIANYAKKNNTFYTIKINGKKSLFYVYNEYKNQLNGYSKSYFDPFCRKKKVIYSYSNGTVNVNFITSIGQLNFFQWAIRYKIIKHVQLHLRDIERDMKETTKINKENKLKNKDIKYVHSSTQEVTVDINDPVICSSDCVNSINLSSLSKNSIKSDSERSHKRHQLSRSVYDYGIKKSNIPIKVDFE